MPHKTSTNKYEDDELLSLLPPKHVLLLPEIMFTILPYLSFRFVVFRFSTICKFARKQVTHHSSKYGQFYWKSIYLQHFGSNALLQQERAPKWLELFAAKCTEQQAAASKTKSINVLQHQVYFAANTCAIKYKFVEGVNLNIMVSQKELKKNKKKATLADEQQFWIEYEQDHPYRVDNVILHCDLYPSVLVECYWCGDCFAMTSCNIFTFEQYYSDYYPKKPLRRPLITFKKYEVINIQEENLAELVLAEGEDEDFYDTQNVDGVKVLMVPNNHIGEQMVSKFAALTNSNASSAPIIVQVMRSMGCECIVACL